MTNTDNITEVGNRFTNDTDRSKSEQIFDSIKVRLRAIYREEHSKAYKEGRDSHADEMRDAATADENLRALLDEFFDNEKELRDISVQKELYEEHQSKTEDSMRKRGVPEYNIA